MKKHFFILSICLNAALGFSQSRLARIQTLAKDDTDVTAAKRNEHDPRYTEEVTVNAVDAKKYFVYRIKLYDKIFGGKVIKESGRTYLYLGGNYPNQTLTVSIKSSALKKSIRSIINYDINVSGEIIGDKDRPYIFVRDEDVKVLTDSKNVIIENNMPK